MGMRKWLLEGKPRRWLAAGCVIAWIGPWLVFPCVFAVAVAGRWEVAHALNIAFFSVPVFFGIASAACMIHYWRAIGFSGWSAQRRVFARSGALVGLMILVPMLLYASYCSFFWLLLVVAAPYKI